MWDIYDELIAGVGEGQIREIFPTKNRMIITSEHGIGTAVRYGAVPEENVLAGMKGVTLKEAAAMIKLWDFPQASIGLAAMNSFYNNHTYTEEHFHALAAADIFRLYEQTITENDPRKFATIGHFPGIPQFPKLQARLTVFELDPRPGDLPASAAEFLLPEIAVVFITASALVNKTLPRLLALAKNAEVIILGASTPLSPVWFEHGVHLLAGTYFNNSHLEKLKQDPNCRKLSCLGKAVVLERKEG